MVTRRRILALAALAVLAVVCSSAGAQPVAGGCGPQTAATLVSLDSQVANNIYRGELSGSEVQVDLKHITTAPDLLAAVAAEDPAATMTAVKRIVYHPFWHIVRLRVYDAAGTLLADFGGPYVIAPVAGDLLSGGTKVGSFEMSVQDDVGFTKLESRFVGDPIGIYVDGRRVVQLGGAFPKRQPSAGTVTLAGVDYSAATLAYNAFPAGTLEAVIAVPTPAATLRAQPCASVTLAEIVRVVKRIAARFYPLAARYGDFVETVHSDTGAVAVVRIGLRSIAGSGGPGPTVLPQSGTVSYEGRSWTVVSWAPTPPARVYLLVPQAA